MGVSGGRGAAGLSPKWFKKIFLKKLYFPKNELLAKKIKSKKFPYKNF
jgi:hypothetical protein